MKKINTLLSLLILLRFFGNSEAQTIEYVHSQDKDNKKILQTQEEELFHKKANSGKINSRFDNPIEHQCYIAILHRNHLDIISAIPLIETGWVNNYDFPTAIMQSYNSGQKGLGDRMIGGNTNADKTVRSNQVGTVGYLQEDFQFEGQTSVLIHQTVSFLFRDSLLLFYQILIQSCYLPAYHNRILFFTFNNKI